jgi:hypothetical protein
MSTQARRDPADGLSAATAEVLERGSDVLEDLDFALRVRQAVDDAMAAGGDPTLVTLRSAGSGYRVAIER